MLDELFRLKWLFFVFASSLSFGREDTLVMVSFWQVKQKGSPLAWQLGSVGIRASLRRI